METCLERLGELRAVEQSADTHYQWQAALKALGARYRPPYNCHHTYATICVMSGMNPAFISQQLGHSVQMLLTTYARWITQAPLGANWRS